MRRTYGMQLTIEKYTQLGAPPDVRDLELAGPSIPAVHMTWGAISGW